MRTRPFFASMFALLLTMGSVYSFAQTSGSRALQGDGVDYERIPCAQIARRVHGVPGTSVSLECPSNCARQPVWGTDIYSDDSSICGAAIHMGLVHVDVGGPIELHFLAGESSYQGSERHGVRSQDWGPWTRSFTITRPHETPSFDETGALIPPAPVVQGRARMQSRQLEATTMAAPQGALVQEEEPTRNRRRGRGRRAEDASSPSEQPTPAMVGAGNELQRYSRSSQLTATDQLPGQIHCETRGQELQGAAGTVHTAYCPIGCGSATIWGTDRYADDSAVCTAAIHAGVIQAANGGLVQVRIEGPHQNFTASERNGIQSARWRAWPRSFTVHTPGSL